MSVHRSLKGRSLLARSRNVFRRIERLEVLEKDGRRQSGDSVYGLPKVRTRLKVKKIRGPAEAKAEAKGAAAKAPAGKAPAAGAKAAAKPAGKDAGKAAKK
jgi:small basic protein (TIGR04137 family)